MSHYAWAGKKSTRSIDFCPHFQGFNALHYAAANGNTNGIIPILDFAPLAVFNLGQFEAFPAAAIQLMNSESQFHDTWTVPRE